MLYIYQQDKWPHFTWDQAKISNLLAEVRYLQGRFLGRMTTLGFKLQEEASLQILTQDILKSSEIEGEILDSDQVRSSLAKRLGIDIGAVPLLDRHVEDIVEITLDATHHYNKALTQDRLYGWHAALFPTGRSGMQRIIVGKWRTKTSGPMQVVSGPYVKQKVHYEAPEYHRLAKEMRDFIKWFNSTSSLDLILKSAMAHFWFVTIHPFEDGNGRIARVLADMMLARAENSKQRFYSMSAQIKQERKEYYAILEKSQKRSLDITLWLEWFLNCLKHAVFSADKLLEKVLVKSQFWNQHAGELFNDRQRKVLNRLLDDFVGNLTSSKWAKLTKCSQDTALRDINDLVERQILIKENAGGRSTNYRIKCII
jgi:Fic family protein